MHLEEKTGKENKMYVIVKHAGHSWSMYYESDPKLGVHISYSAHSTHTGSVVGIQDSYDSEEEGTEDLRKMLIANPVGDYAICKVLEE